MPRHEKNEADYVVVVWANHPDEHPHARPFQTITFENSRRPVAWNLNHLRQHHPTLISNTHIVFSEEDLRSWMSPPLYHTSTRENPLLIPIPFARSVLAWNDFDFWDFRV